MTGGKLVEVSISVGMKKQKGQPFTGRRMIVARDSSPALKKGSGIGFGCFFGPSRWG